ncbi:MAG: 16S rRNA (cytidine(1402)-2'-O)-methyltransferase [Candidatus Hydrogenedentota bacterium]
MGCLYLIATPIGNLEDISYRAIRILKEIDVLACEDTRVTRKLLTHYEIPKPSLVFSHHQHNENRSAPGIVKLLDEGKTVALCTDGGYPGISDPGYRLVHEATAQGHEVIVIPGASAVPTALVLSALPSSSFLFRGFPPKKTGQRQNFFRKDEDLPHTLIYFESPKRIADFLADAFAVFGDRQAAACLELTKKFERVHRSYLSELTESFAGEPPKGEITVVIAGNNPKFRRD